MIASIPRASRRRAARRSPLTRVLVFGLLGVLVVVGTCAAFATLRLRSVERDLLAAQDLVDAAGVAIEEGRLADARDGLARASSLLLAANNDLYSSASLDAIGWLPVVDENLDALRRSVGLALTVADGGARLLDVAAPLEDDQGRLEVSLRGGTIPLDAVAAASLQAQNVASALPGPEEVVDDGRLVAQVRDLQRRVFDEAATRRTQLVTLGNGLALLGDMAGANGPRRYLLAIANTAEMRGSGGMVLSYGVLEGADGGFTLSAFGPIDELFLDPEEAPLIDIPADELERWGHLEPARLWRNANLVPDFTVVGPRLETMYESATGQSADGVIQIDAQGLAAILEGIGPVEVPGLGTIGADNVVATTLNQVYFQFAGAQEQRREVLGEVAEVVFDRLVDGDYPSLRGLATALARSVDERHIVLWSSSRPAESAAVFFGADGALPPPSTQDAFAMTVQNLGRDKLDFYLRTDVRLTGSRPQQEPGAVTVEVTLSNDAPPGQTFPSYVFGVPTDRPRGVAPGVYVGAVTLYLPDGTVLVGSAGGASVGQVEAENGRTVVSADVEVPPGGAVSFVLDLALATRPVGAAELVLVPSPRVNPTAWTVALDTGNGAIERSGPLVVAERRRDDGTVRQGQAARVSN